MKKESTKVGSFLLSPSYTEALRLYLQIKTSVLLLRLSLFDNQESIFNGEWIVFIDAVVEHDTVSMVDFMLNNN